MKAAKLGVIDRQVISGDAVPLEVKRVIQRAIDETYFRVSLAAGRVVYQGAVTEVIAGDAAVMRFPDGATTVAQSTFPSRKLWVKTRPVLSVWYSGSASSVATFNFRLIIRAYGPGGTTTGAIVTLLDWSAPGPAVAGGALFTTAISTSAFPSSPFGTVQVELRRLGAADANSGNLDVLAAEVTFQEFA